MTNYILTVPVTYKKTAKRKHPTAASARSSKTTKTIMARCFCQSNSIFPWASQNWWHSSPNPKATRKVSKANKPCGLGRRMPPRFRHRRKPSTQTSEDYATSDRARS